MRTVVPFAVSSRKRDFRPFFHTTSAANSHEPCLKTLTAGLRAVGQEPEVLATDGSTSTRRSLSTTARSTRPSTTCSTPPTKRSPSSWPTSRSRRRLPSKGCSAPTRTSSSRRGRGGGTNAFVARHPGFRVDYHDASIRDHRRIARELTDDVVEVDSFRLATDVTTPRTWPRSCSTARARLPTGSKPADSKPPSTTGA